MTNPQSHADVADPQIHADITDPQIHADSRRFMAPGIGLAFAASLVVAAAIAVSARQAPAPALRIVSPEERSLVAGPVTIAAAVEPAGATVQRVTFFVDGRRVCRVERPPFECGWNVGLAIKEHTFHVVAFLSDGRRVAQTVRTRGAAGFIENADVNAVHVTVTALDGNGFATGLASGAFHVYEDNVEQPITYFAATDIPLELVAGIDVSGSMAASIDEMKENVKRFLSALQPSDRVTLTAFNENFFVLARPTADLATRLASVAYLAPFGSTSLHDALLRSFDLLGSQSGRHAVVIFTDGADTSSRVSREAVEQRAETSDAVLYMIGQGSAIGSPALKSLSDRLAQKSGGRAFFPRRIEDVRAVFDEIVAELSHQYLLGYAPPSVRRDSTWHRIRVEISGGRYQVRARQGYRFRTPG